MESDDLDQRKEFPAAALAKIIENLWSLQKAGPVAFPSGLHLEEQFLGAALTIRRKAAQFI